MFLAYASSLRSGQLGRQVGAAIASRLETSSRSVAMTFPSREEGCTGRVKTTGETTFWDLTLMTSSATRLPIYWSAVYRRSCTKALRSSLGNLSGMSSILRNMVEPCMPKWMPC